MSDVSTIYDEVLVELAALYPNKKRLYNSYNLNDNPSYVLEDGYGLAIGAGTFVDAEFNSVWENTSFIVPLTVQVIKTQENVTLMDDAIKTLLENLKSLQVLFCRSDQLGIQSNIESIQLGGRSAVEFILGDSEQFVTISQTLEITYSDAIPF
jgi:hypothetical protein